MKKTVYSSAGKLITITVMCCCLLFLSGINFIFYPPSHSTFCSSTHGNGNDASDEEMPVPAGEKNSGKINNVLEEDYLHDFHLLRELSAISISSKYIHCTPAKLQAVHFELISPPPEV